MCIPVATGYNFAMRSAKTVQTALKAALKTRKNSYSPYSKFKVGAALKLHNVEDPVTGTNVENASFGGTICAERAAVLRAVAEHGAIHPEFLVVATDEKKATVPCALCLQVLAEFCDDDMPVYLGNKGGIQRECRFSDLLPEPFRSFKAK